MVNTVHLLFSVEDVVTWSCNRVSKFVATIRGCEKYARRFLEEEVDEQAFMDLDRPDLTLIGLKLGPAIKIAKLIRCIKEN